MHSPPQSPSLLKQRGGSDIFTEIKLPLLWFTREEPVPLRREGWGDEYMYYFR